MAVLDHVEVGLASGERFEVAQRSVSVAERMGHVIDRVVDVIHFMPREPSLNSSEWFNRTRSNVDTRVPRFNNGLPWSP